MPNEGTPQPDNGPNDAGAQWAVNPAELNNDDFPAVGSAQHPGNQVPAWVTPDMQDAAAISRDSLVTEDQTSSDDLPLHPGTDYEQAVAAFGARTAAMEAERVAILAKPPGENMITEVPPTDTPVEPENTNPTQMITEVPKN